VDNRKHSGDPVQIAHQQHAQQNLGVDGGTPHRAVGISQPFPHEPKIYAAIQAFQEMIIRDLIF
jgi:hypothetical protein